MNANWTRRTAFTLALLMAASSVLSAALHTHGHPAGSDCQASPLVRSTVHPHDHDHLHRPAPCRDLPGNRVSVDQEDHCFACQYLSQLVDPGVHGQAAPGWQVTAPQPTWAPPVIVRWKSHCGLSRAPPLFPVLQAI